uniref:BMP binding endothelial regulator n=1 Tax=Periophthalmus magnuspinnatus TaxID=409849 RepID=A0A3B3ZWP7_9GOBI
MCTLLLAPFQNEVVSCEKRPCPVQCSHPVPSDSCCPVCESCLYEGGVHPHGSTFTPSEPCQRCTCVRGSVTCMPLLCPKPACSKPVTKPGQCCPACPGMLYEGSSWFADSSPCVTCMCVDGVTTCSEVRCISPCNNFISMPGECCPVCAGNYCIFEGKVYGPGESFHPADDPCQICNCEVMPDGEQHLRCYRKQCPSLVDCPKTNILFSGPDSCCPVCARQNHSLSVFVFFLRFMLHKMNCLFILTLQIMMLWLVLLVSAVPCVYQGEEYQWSERWPVDECTICTCVFGEVHCHTERCPPLTCMPVVVPGLCCPHCIPRPATCIAFGDPHYRTFDGRMLHFQGACTYVLAQDCEGGDFSIHATNDDRGRKGVSWTKEVTVFIGNVSVQLLQDWAVKVSVIILDQKLALNWMFVTVQVLWSGRSHLEVSVPGTYKSRTCGLCGNFNNYYQDDLKMPSGKISPSESEFGNSWRVELCLVSFTYAGFQAKKSANTRCKVLKSSVFKACHRVVPPEPWYGACVYDLCACGANADECLCDTLEAYASQCREAGVVLQWRSPSLSVGCPMERGFVFDECGPLCPVTCFNKDVPLGVIENHCFKPCVPGCQCPAGLVLHNNYCIQPDKCPKIIHEKDNKQTLTSGN